VVLERVEGCAVWGEPRLRAAELDAGGAVASAELGRLPDGRARLHRPDLVLFPDPALPVAVEAELSVKGAPRLEAICRVWARCRLVSEVRYYAPPLSRVRFPVPFRRFTPGRHPSPVLGRRVEGGLWMSASPLDPMMHMLTSLALDRLADLAVQPLGSCW
jgi:hypothetical protein